MIGRDGNQFGYLLFMVSQTSASGADVVFPAIDGTAGWLAIGVVLRTAIVAILAASCG
jgi:hypothetical protein